MYLVGFILGISFPQKHELMKLASSAIIIMDNYSKYNEKAGG